MLVESFKKSIGNSAALHRQYRRSISRKANFSTAHKGEVQIQWNKTTCKKLNAKGSIGSLAQELAKIADPLSYLCSVVHQSSYGID